MVVDFLKPWGVFGIGETGQVPDSLLGQLSEAGIVRVRTASVVPAVQPETRQVLEAMGQSSTEAIGCEEPMPVVQPDRPRPYPGQQRRNK